MGTPKKPENKKIDPKSIADDEDDDSLDLPPKKKVDDDDDFDGPLDDDLGFESFDEDEDDDY
jgi:hypothetical protein